MKTLLLLRHAKSSWKEVQVEDHDRPLNRRGKRDAPRMGLWLSQAHLCPDVIVSSTAKRARKTASRVANNCHYQGIIELDGTLYLAPPEAYLAVMQRFDDHISCALMIGHNPGLEQLLALLTGQEQLLPTAALARVELDISQWHEVNSQTRGSLCGLWLPADLE